MEIDSKSKRVCRVFQAYPADKVWVEVKSLGDMMLFLNRKSYISISVGATGGGKVNRIGGKHQLEGLRDSSFCVESITPSPRFGGFLSRAVFFYFGVHKRIIDGVLGLAMWSFQVTISKILDKIILA
ncbi:hypothetical protein MRB53_024913 [Persea americana]|uniref:Uncharacterized protein n=1 Tax=Persea americana TaxID=3435 RepID=A0ACC2LDR0_PERAE|nr:hypothetical protein MRB53_024913 [Persea americana]